MIAVLNLILAVIGIVLFRWLIRLPMPELVLAALGIVFLIVAYHVGFRLITGHWNDGVVRVGPRPDRRSR